MKRAGFIIGFVLVAIGLELSRQKFGLPIVVGDLIVSPISLGLIFYFGKSTIADIRSKGKSAVIHGSLWICWSSILWIALGAGLIWMSWGNMFEYFTGVKGPGHGYSVFLGGVAIVLLGLHLGIRGFFVWARGRC